MGDILMPMITPGRINVNQSVSVPMTFTNSAGANYDPATVVFRTVDPMDVNRSYTYGTDSEVTKTATGKYKATIAPNMCGRWFYRWEDTSTLVKEDDFIVHESAFYQDIGGDYA